MSQQREPSASSSLSFSHQNVVAPHGSTQSTNPNTAHALMSQRSQSRVQQVSSSSAVHQQSSYGASSQQQQQQPINGIRTDVDPNKVYSVQAREGHSGNNVDISYTSLKAIGNGSFGVVFQAKVVQTGELVAIKKVLQDKRFKNRELQIMRMLNHPDVVDLRYFFYSNGEKKDEVFLNLVLEYVPETVYKACRHYAKLKQPMPPLQVKV